MESERKSDKLLRAYAKQRRAEAGEAFKLHPATRWLLQGEVARRAPKPAAAGAGLRLWTLLRKRWAVVSGLALIVVLGAGLLLPSLNQEKIINTRAMSHLQPVDNAAPVAAMNRLDQLPATLDVLTNRSGLALAVAEKAASQKLSEPSPPIAVAAAAPVVVPPNASGFSAIGGAATAAAAPSGSSVSGAIAATGEFAPAAAARNLNTDKFSVAQDSAIFKSEPTENSFASGLNNSRRFVQTAKAKNQPVLQTFEVQQNGSAIAVVDRDGSVYNGTVQPAEVAAQNDWPKVKAAADQPPLFDDATKDLPVGGDKFLPAQNQNFSFRVSGANRSLKQNVVFVGNVITLSNTTANGAQNVGGGNNRPTPSAAANNRQQQLFSNSRISGTVTIDRTNRMEINAVPAEP